MFEPLPAQFSFPEAEQRILEFWEQHDIFARSLEQRRGAERWVFYEGPPTANGLPHPGHCLTRAMKDLFPRYHTMCGKLVERKAGWDTHGLPVEVEVCKELGIHSKEEIEAYGVEKFVRLCIESVFRYVGQWEHMTRRLGFWVNLEDAYVTFHQSYVESVWWSLKTLFERGLLYQGHKVVWWWAQGGTALSAGEVGEGYRTVQDPSVYVRFPLVAGGSEDSRIQGSERRTRPPHLNPRILESSNPRVSLLVWTTTPWTLISNHFAAVGPDIDYALVYDKTTDEYLYIASALVQDVADKVKHDFEALGVCKGSDLVGLRYIPPFRSAYYDRHPQGFRFESLFVQCDEPNATLGESTVWVAHDSRVSQTSPTRAVRQSIRFDDGIEREFIGWRVLGADFVTLDSGTGLVHQAPAYGEADFDLWRKVCDQLLPGIPLLNAVAPNGTFTDEAPEFCRGRWVKDCDKDIVRELRNRSILYHQETVEHEYPFCPRAEDDPLIQYARKSWFVRTSQFKDEFLANNAGITWLPEHIKEGRFGDFLRNNVDWALSRERYWGTPLPIWVCEMTGKMEAIGSLAELKAKPGASDGGLWQRKKAEDPALPDHLSVHKPYIDEWTYDSPYVEGSGKSDGAVAADPRVGRPRMRRVPEVIDCWWDAGSMPFAQWGFPHVEGSVETFARRFPANFISEALDQTRGWFYGMLAISTLLYGQQRDEAKLPPDIPRPDSGHPYKACIVLGLMMGEDGLKMSKRKKNYREPTYVFDHYGADAMRWFFLSSQTPWTSVRFEEHNIRDAHREFLVRLYNVFSFFSIYANIDGFAVEGSGIRDQGSGDGASAAVGHSVGAGTGWRAVAQRGELDRWIVSELHRTTKTVRECLDRFENYPAAGRLNDFVDALSNWYVRRSRDRFWRPLTGDAHSAADQDKWDAYNTLHEVLVALAKLIAPFTPFFAETMYQNLVRAADEIRDSRIQGSEDSSREDAGRPRSGLGGREAPAGQPLNPGILESSNPPPSVHLCDYPVADEALIDEDLAQEMDLVRQIVSLGRAARTASKLKVRQPLALAEIILVRREHAGWLEEHRDLIAEELNIKAVEFSTEAEQYVTYQIKPDFKAIGPKFGKLARRVAAALEKIDAEEARKTLTTTGRLTLDVDGQPVHLTDQDIHVRLEARPGWSAAQGRAGVVVVKTELTEELRDEGLCRELIHQVQSLRKDRDLAYQTRVRLHVEAPEAVLKVVRDFGQTIQAECLAAIIDHSPAAADVDTQTSKIEGHEVKIAIVPL